MTPPLDLPVELLIDGRAIAVRPLTVGQLPAFLSASLPVARELAAGDVYAALAGNADAVVAAVAIGAGVERAWLNERGVDALVELAAAVIEVNADFFVRTLLPRALAASDRLTALATAAVTLTGGATGSSASSAPASVIAP